MKINILLADDHTIVTDGIKTLLNFHDEFEVVFCATHGEEALDYLSRGNPVDVIVLDINMPVMDGISCAKKIKASYPNIKVIILTMYAQSNFIEEIIRMGIDGCLLKNNTGKELKDAILRVYQGHDYYDSFQAKAGSRDSVNTVRLSDREIEIVKLLAEGLTSQQIAERLFISENTVKTHRKNILKKTKLHSTSDLIKFALNRGVI